MIVRLEKRAAVVFGVILPDGAWRQSTSLVTWRTDAGCWNLRRASGLDPLTTPPLPQLAS
jgi:hypothetical protein